MYDVREIQARLEQLGFAPGPIDGLLGPQTEAAIVAFKRSIGLRPRPYVGELTYAALMVEAPETTIPWMSEAVRIKGLHEARDTATLRKWFDASLAWVDPREVPWCGAFVATVMRKWEPHILLPENPLLARNWSNFGLPCASQLGAILTFSRPGSSWSGHVGFYWGEDATAYHVLGGNQSNAVTITRMSKDRHISSRWPLAVPQRHHRVFLKNNGTPLSRNER